MSPDGGARAPGAAPARAAYAERQVRCLEAMGLTAWVSRGGTAAPAVVPVPDGAATRAAQVSVEPVAAPGPAPVSAPEPDPPAIARPDAPGDGLAGRRVRAFRRRGDSVFETNPGAGRVLVVVEPDGTDPDTAADAPPLDGEPAALFRLMLRSIGLGPGDVSVCGLAPPGAGGAEGVPAVGELLAGRRTVLRLTHPPAAPEDPDPGLRAAGAAGFALAHPATLLERPALKREAWATLKAVRRRLGDAPAGGGA